MNEMTRRGFGFADVLAGVSVALVVIPQSLAYAELAGMPAYTGLYAAALPALAAAPMASSRYLQTGPVAMTSLLSFGALSSVATPGTDEYIGLALLLALMVGVVRLGLGLLKGGMITDFMSPSVVLGFTTAAAILIMASQSASIFGFTDPPAGLVARLFEVLTSPGDWYLPAVLVSIATAAIIVGGRRVHRLFPGVLLAVIVGILVASQIGYDGPVVGAIPEGLPPLSLALPWTRVLDLIVPAVIIAMVGFAEPTAIARTMAMHDRERWDANRELISQGIANIASGLSGGFPVGGSFSRSSINRLAGARSRWSGAVTGLTVLAFMPFAGAISQLPRAVLGAIVVVGVAGLVKVPEMIRLRDVSWGQAFIAWATAAATIILSPRIDIAVLVGMLVAAAVHIYREASRVRIIAEYSEPHLELRLGGVLFYASAGPLEQALSDQVVANPGVQRLSLDLTRLGRIDHSGVLMLQNFVRDARDAGLEVEIVNVPAHARGIFERSGGV